MKEEIINKFLEKALQYLQTAEAFTAKEVPEYIRELLSFKMMEHIIDGLSAYMIVGGFVTLITLIITSIALDGDKSYPTLKRAVVGLLFGFFVSLPFGLGIATNDFMQAYKAYSAPRVYLIEYFRKEIK